jgi:hypothetical protein
MIMTDLHHQSNGEDHGRAAQLVHEADALIAERERELAELRSRRDQIDQAFRVKAAEQQAARERERVEHHAEAVAALHAAEERRLHAVDKFEQGMAFVAEAINEAFAAADDVRMAARDLLRMAGVDRPNPGLHGLDQAEFVRRCAGRLAATMAMKVRGATHRFGGLSWSEAAWTLEREPGWSERERRAAAADISRLTGGTQ